MTVELAVGSVCLTFLHPSLAFQAVHISGECKGHPFQQLEHEGSDALLSAGLPGIVFGNVAVSVLLLAAQQETAARDLTLMWSSVSVENVGLPATTSASCQTFYWNAL